MRVLVGVGIAAALTLASLGSAVERGGRSGPPASPPAAAAGQVAIVQAVPGETVDVTIDGKAVESGVDSGQVLGPYSLSEGSHQVDFSGGDGIEQATTVEVAAGSNQDVVLHLPASVGGDALVTTYPAPVEPIGPGKARVLVAHTATWLPPTSRSTARSCSERRQRRVRDRGRPGRRARRRAVPDGRDDRPDPRAADRRPGPTQPHHGLRGGQPRDRLHGPGRAHGRSSPRTARLVPPDDRHRFRGAGRRHTGDAVRTPGPLRSGLGRWGANGYGAVRRRRVVPALVAVVVAAVGMAWGLSRLGAGPAPRTTTPSTCQAVRAPRPSPTTARHRRRHRRLRLPRPRPDERGWWRRPRRRSACRAVRRRRRRGLDDGRRPARRPRRHPYRRAGGAAARGSATPSGRR